MFLALKENTLRKFLKGFLVSFWLVLGEEKSTEQFINVSSILLNLLFADKCIV